MSEEKKQDDSTDDSDKNDSWKSESEEDTLDDSDEENTTDDSDEENITDGSTTDDSDEGDIPEDASHAADQEVGNNTGQTTPVKVKKTLAVMTYNELVAWVGVRKAQYTDGAPYLGPKTSGDEKRSGAELVIAELKAGKSPCIIKRRVYSGHHEEWHINELNADDAIRRYNEV